MKKILIVEDDPIVAHIYQTRLEKEGYEVEIAPDGQSGFYRIHEFKPDAVLLDLMLPKMNGVEILKKIRAQGKFAQTPVIVFTNAYVPNMIHESFQAGATQVFNKATLTPRQIIEAIQNALSYSSMPPVAAAAPTPPSPPAENDPAVERGVVPGEVEEPFHGTGSRNTPVSNLVQLPPPQDEGDLKFQADLLQTFLNTAPDTLAQLRRGMQDFTKAADDSARLPLVLELYRKIHALTGSAGLAGLHDISQMAAALEVLLKELFEKPKNINASTLRTVAHSIDFVGELITRGSGADLLSGTPVNILVVDDEILSRRAVTYALEKANLKSISVEEPQVALNLAGENFYDLIFLDVQMPGMDGFELCTKIRALPTCKNTPIIFVTSLTDFKSRARSSLSGGTDLIAKPFMFIELSVKALTYVLRSRLMKGKGHATAVAA
ncbi:MAG: response regulator [Verrucomicrobia subdivision 3 bacterium]|nr:response regulator [Limisphaerales bacterium]